MKRYFLRICNHDIVSNGDSTFHTWKFHKADGFKKHQGG
jgi:hypothetical protein